MKKVSSSQIDRLYRFTRQHYVEFYDVQTELVDHLANGIEEQWRESPELPFEEALQKEFKKFGVYGFSDVVEKRQRAMEKKYFKLIWKEAKNILREPKLVLLILGLYGLSYYLLTSQEGIYALMALVVVFFILSLFYIGKKSSKLKKKIEGGEKVYLLETLIFNAGGSFSLLWIPFHFLNFSGVSGNFYINIFMAFLVVVIVITSYICFYKLPKKKDEILKKAHPELKFLQ